MGGILVVGDDEDVGIRAAVAAAARRVRPGRLVWATGAALAAADWIHTVDRSGLGTTRCGAVARGARVWFRSTTVAPVCRWADPRDKDYAAAEYGALLASWLRQPETRTVNEVDGASPWGPSWTTARWRKAATRVGLAAVPLGGVSSARLMPGPQAATADGEAPCRPSPRSWPGPEVEQLVLVVGEHVIDVDGPTQAAGCERLAAAARCAVLEVAFDADGRMADARPLAAVDTPAKIAAVADFLIVEAS